MKKTTVKSTLELDKKQFEKYTNFLVWLKKDRKKFTLIPTPGTTITTPVLRFNIELKEIDKAVPEDEAESFVEWVCSLPMKCGTGHSKEYYSYTENYQDDIGVMVKITVLE